MKVLGLLIILSGLAAAPGRASSKDAQANVDSIVSSYQEKMTTTEAAQFTGRIVTKVLCKVMRDPFKIWYVGKFGWKNKYYTELKFKSTEQQEELYEHGYSDDDFSDDLFRFLRGLRDFAGGLSDGSVVHRIYPRMIATEQEIPAELDDYNCQIPGPLHIVPPSSTDSLSEE